MNNLETSNIWYAFYSINAPKVGSGLLEEPMTIDDISFMSNKKNFNELFLDSIPLSLHGNYKIESDAAISYNEAYDIAQDKILHVLPALSYYHGEKLVLGGLSIDTSDKLGVTGRIFCL